MTELRDPELAASWFATGWPLARVPGVPRAAAVGWFLTLLAERPGLPPPGCVVDLATLAMEGPYTRLGGPTPDDPTLRRALRDWEDQVLGRLASDPRLAGVQDAVLALPPALRPEAAGLFAALVLARLCPERGGDRGELAVVPGVVRRELVQPGGAGPTQRAVELLVAGYEGLVAGARLVPELLGPGDVFLLTWMERLRSLEARVALDQLATAAAGTELPRRVRSRRRVGTALSRIEEESAYPVGGFSSISTSGALENLVTSELAYMREDDGPAGEPDLFDLRWAEGELLYYSRDEGAHHREHRAILVLLDPSVDGERAAEGGVQRLILVLGRLVAVLRRAGELLGELELHVRVAVEPGVLGLEHDLVGVLLDDWVKRQVLVLAREPRAASDAWLAERARFGAVDCVVVRATGVDAPWTPAERALSRVKPLDLDFFTDPVALLRALV